MKILVLNCGSSSVKYKLIDTATDNVMAEGGVEKIGLPDGFLKYKLSDGSKAIKELGLVDHKGAVKAVLDILTDPELGCISSYDEIDAVGHRVVHGAEKFSKSVLITDEVLQQVKECYDLAPLHNPANVTGIEAVEEILPGIPQVGVFDTAFHQTMPAKSYMYALPYRFYKEDGVRRYGFHGTSHRYVSARVCEILGVDIEKQRIITCHIGNGGSITAVLNGKSYDTSMGFSPVDGLVMGTRCGNVDPSAVTFIGEKEQMSYAEVNNMLNKQSGVFGVSGVSSDMRDIDKAYEEGNPRAILARDMYCLRIKKFVGEYAAEMGGVDLIVFTGGVGENSPETRKEVCEGLEFMGVHFDRKINEGLRGENKIISAADSKVKVAVVPTNEELVIATDTYEIVNK